MSPMHQLLIGEMTNDLETAYLWLRRQLELETSEPPLLPKDHVIRQWRMSKGSVCEAAFRVGISAMKACGTSSTGNSGVIARGIRDLSMGADDSRQPRWFHAKNELPTLLWRKRAEPENRFATSASFSANSALGDRCTILCGELSEKRRVR
jgi:hypothetical protein